MNHHRPENDPIKRQQRNLKKLERRNSLLDNLRNDVYCRLGVSKISGVGIISVRHVPRGTEILKFSNNTPNETVEISENEILKLDPLVADYVSDMLVKTEYGSYHFPSKGMNSINVSFYLNHSDTPNVEFSTEGESGEFLSFVSIKDIEAGQEITQDYSNLSHNKKELLKQFPFLHGKK